MRNSASTALRIPASEATEIYSEIAGQIDTVGDLDRMALADLDEALAKRPDLAGATEIREKLLERRSELERQAG